MRGASAAKKKLPTESFPPQFNYIHCAVLCASGLCRGTNGRRDAKYQLVFPCFVLCPFYFSLSMHLSLVNNCRSRSVQIVVIRNWFGANKLLADGKYTEYRQ